MGWMARAGERGAAYPRTRTRGCAFASARAPRAGGCRGGVRVVRCDVVTDGVYALFVVRR